MIARINKGQDIKSVDTIEIDVSVDEKFTISFDKIKGLVVNKTQYGSGEGNIKITPHVSNEISIK